MRSLTQNKMARITSGCYLGYLVYKSRALPRFLGVLLVVDGIAVLIWFFQALLLPAHHGIIYPGLVVSFIAEVGLALWLLVKGVKVADPGATKELEVSA